MENLRKENKLIDIFCTLAEIPSPSLKEEKVAEKILSVFKENNINAKKDSYGNIIAKIAPTDNTKKMLLLSSHMDVVGDDSPVNIRLNGEIIETDKTRTLGADDKAGVAAAIMLAIELNNNKELKHGGLEIVFTRDEEQNMTGIHNLETDKLEAEHILVLDADKLGQFLISGASYTKLTVKVKTLKGGHSGIDIGDKTRINAANLIAEIVNKIPQGVYKEDEYGVVTSINLGVIAGGGIETAIDSIKNSEIKSGKYLDVIAEKAVTNIINTNSTAIYSIRSSSKEYENNLINDIKEIVKNYNEKYKNLAQITLEISEHLPPFEKSSDEVLIDTAKKAGEKLNMKLDISSFHAGAETHIYANKKNKNGITFKPVLAGTADVFNMHSNEEQMNYISYLQGYKFIKEFFIQFNT